MLVGSRRVPKPLAKKIARSSATKFADQSIRKTKMIRKASAYSRKLSKHLKKERAKATKKNGDFKKGWNQSRVMRTAHDMVRRMR